VKVSQSLPDESQRAVRASRDAVLASKALIEQSDRTIERLRMIVDDPPDIEAEAQSSRAENSFEMISDRTFEDELVTLDGRHFRNCEFNRCTLEYGGQTVIFESTGFHSCRFRFTAEAAMTVRFLETFELMLPDDKVSYAAVPSQNSRRQLPN
jgi:hypothetical protein